MGTIWCREPRHYWPLSFNFLVCGFHVVSRTSTLLTTLVQPTSLRVPCGVLNLSFAGHSRSIYRFMGSMWCPEPQLCWPLSFNLLVYGFRMVSWTSPLLITLVQFALYGFHLVSWTSTLLATLVQFTSSWVPYDVLNFNFIDKNWPLS